MKRTNKTNYCITSYNNLAFAKIIIIAILTYLSFAPVFAQSQGINFDRADIRSVIYEFSIRTGKIFVIDPRVSGDITIVSPPDIIYTEDEVWEIFKASLRVNGFSVVPISSNQYRIVPLQGSVRGGVSYSGGMFEIEIIKLENIQAREAVQSIQSFLGEGSIITALNALNAVIISDTRENIELAKDIIAKFDKVDKRITISLENLQASQAKKLIDTILAKHKVSFEVTVLESINKIIVTGTNEMLKEVRDLVRTIDVKASNEEVGMRVIDLNNLNAEEAAPLIQSALGPSISEGISIVPVKENNRLIINAPPYIVEKIVNLVSQMDEAKPQVMVEAIIVQLSDETSRDIGFQYFHSGEQGTVPFSSSTFSDTNSPNLFTIAAATYLNSKDGAELSAVVGNSITTQAVSSLLSSQGFTLGSTGTLKDGSVIGAMLRAIETDTNSNILSTPSLVTLSGKAATMQIGQNIPVTAGESLGTNLNNVFRQVQRQDIGIILEIEPHVNYDGTIKLKIKQEISSVDTTLSTGSGADDFAINKTVVETELLAEDNQFLIIGGLTDQNHSVSKRKVPLLGDAPVIGNLFKSQGRNQRKRKLSIFIRPKIIWNSEKAKEITNESRDKILNQRLITGKKVSDSITQLIDDLPKEWSEK